VAEVCITKNNTTFYNNVVKMRGPGFQLLSFIHNLLVGSHSLTRGHHRCPWKHRSTVRTEHRLEAYATLRRRVFTPGARG
jgi:hypothetical protein